MAKATEAIFLRVNVEDARALRKAARTMRMPLATFVRWAALRWVGEYLGLEKPPTNRAPVNAQ